MSPGAARRTGHGSALSIPTASPPRRTTPHHGRRAHSPSPRGSRATWLPGRMATWPHGRMAAALLGPSRRRLRAVHRSQPAQPRFPNPSGFDVQIVPPTPALSSSPPCRTPSPGVPSPSPSAGVHHAHIRIPCRLLPHEPPPVPLFLTTTGALSPGAALALTACGGGGSGSSSSDSAEPAGQTDIDRAMKTPTGLSSGPGFRTSPRRSRSSRRSTRVRGPRTRSSPTP